MEAICLASRSQQGPRYFASETMDISIGLPAGFLPTEDKPVLNPAPVASTLNSSFVLPGQLPEISIEVAVSLTFVYLQSSRSSMPFSTSAAEMQRFFVSDDFSWFGGKP